ncbi:MAG: hypothetical protein LUE93_03210 [Bacteroides sp.]|nr:hypothetical protein [Bacteroides sp.]
MEPPQTLDPVWEEPTVSTNGVATRSIDAIYLLEVLPPEEYLEGGNFSRE